MLFWLGQALSEVWGPFRQLTFYLTLTGLGTAVAALSTWLLLPRLWLRLPTDKGRAHAVGAESSIGKPVSAGSIFIPLFCIVVLLFVPWSAAIVEAVLCLLAAMAVGHVDDRTRGGLSEYTLAAFDAGIAFAGAAVVCQLAPTQLWLPFVAGSYEVPPILFVPVGAGLIWLSINATNCSDGVDGLSGSLCVVALMALGVMLYLIVGHEQISAYLLLPHYTHAAQWGMLAFLMIGCLAGYLWYNAPPSSVLMGDAGSRPLGLLIGMLVVATGNPLFLLLVGAVIVLNGATGLVKVALMRFFGLKLLAGVRFPLHDHCRKELGWTNSQVLVRFMLVHLGLSALLVTLVLKVR